MTDREHLELLLSKIFARERCMTAKVKMLPKNGDITFNYYKTLAVEMKQYKRMLETIIRIENKIDKLLVKVTAHETALKRAK